MENAVAPAPAVAQPQTTLDQYKRMFADARDLLADNRKDQQIDDDYYHGYQLTADERRVLQKRKQPDTVFNRYRKAINGTLGVLKQGATDPQAYPRNPGDEDSADVVSKTLRYAADINDFDDMRIDCAYDYLVPGTCAALVEVDDMRRPKLTQIRWEEFFHDPRSRRKDFSDARYMGIAKWMYADTVAAMYDEKKIEIEATIDSGSTGVTVDDTFQDRPTDNISQWIDRKKRRLMVVEIYHLEGEQWFRCVFHAGGILEAAVSPWLDDRKKPCCGIVAQSCYVDRENNRMGIGRDMRSPQDEFNKRRSKLLHLLSNRQLEVPDPNNFMPVDADAARAEAARPDGVLPPGFRAVALNDITGGQFQLLAMAEGEMDREGPNPAILGRQGESQSGRAQLVRQQAGLTEQAVIFGGIESWELRIYRAMWNRCRQFWTAPDYVRVTDDEGAPQFIGINQPQVQEVPAIVAHPQTGQPVIGTHQVILGYENQLAELDVDISLDTVPDTANMASEQFGVLSELGKAGQIQLTTEQWIKLSGVPGKRQLLDALKGDQQPDPMAEQAKQLQVQTAAAELENTQADTEQKRTAAALNMARAGNEQVQPMIEGAKLGHAAAQPAAGDNGRIAGSSA